MKTAVLRSRLAGRIWRVGSLAMMMLAMSCASSGPVIMVEPSVSSLPVNNMVRASVTVKNITDLIAFEAHLSFDANVLEVMALNHGGFIKTDFIIQNTFDNVAGTIDYAVAQIDHPPGSGDGTLFEIVFRAKGPGQSPIRFRQTQAVPAGALLSDSHGMAINVALIDGNISVAE